MDTLVELTEESLSKKYDLPDGVLVSQIRKKPYDNKRRKFLKNARERLAMNVGNTILNIVDGIEEVMIAGGVVTASLIECGHGDTDLYICTENDRIRTLVLDNIIHKVIETKPHAVGRSEFAISFMDNGNSIIQIVLTSDCTPEKVLQHFDVDSCCFCYTKGKFFGLKRGLRALKTQTNVVDESRKTCAYEYRLVKYYKRGFDILLPGVHFVDLSPEKLQKEKHGVALLARYNKITSPFGICSYYEEKGATLSSPWSNIATAYNAILRGKRPFTVSAYAEDYHTVIDNGKYPERFVKSFINRMTKSMMKKLTTSIAVWSKIMPDTNFNDIDMEEKLANMLVDVEQQLLNFTLVSIKFVSSDIMKHICIDRMTEKQKHDWLCLRDP
jgi:hypothetical protein